ncbi:hypothetical protein BDN70DRAFT_900582 [Pholiota conissans]|uniref:Uncharacterized protein n=1 Tax=Pholiota conissans TaxID=109636 RepID=A0A9P5YNG1_9AGAR|nr:hypothetical protein BDN70DRAFT_900582 [Pholiota conissans]
MLLSMNDHSAENGCWGNRDRGGSEGPGAAAGGDVGWQRAARTRALWTVGKTASGKNQRRKGMSNNGTHVFGVGKQWPILRQLRIREMDRAASEMGQSEGEIQKGSKVAMVEFERGASGTDVAAQEPHKLVRILEFGAEFLANDVKAFGKVGGCRDKGVFRENGKEGRVIVVVGKEWSLFGGRIFGVVENKFSEREIVYPIILVVRRIGVEIGLERLIGSFQKLIQKTSHGQK